MDRSENSTEPCDTCTMLSRPAPPREILIAESDAFAPAPELVAWALATFTDPASPLYNERHDHLVDARLGALWTNMTNEAKGLRVAAQAEIPRPPVTGGKWSRGRWLAQVLEWFGDVPDFILTFDAVIAADVSDATFCALVEHELCHCAQARDAFGAPKFTKDGMPVFSIRGHDVEEFVDIVRRYGVDASAGLTRSFVEAASYPPLVPGEAISLACGTCAQAA